MSTFNIDPTKIKPNMVIHTPTLEQAKAVCTYINNKKFIYFKDYKEATCIATNDGTYWSYSPKSFYKDEGYTITPFEDILVKEPKYKPGDKILVKPNLGGHCNTTLDMETLIGKVVTIKEHRSGDYYSIEEMEYAWHTQMFEPAPTPNQTTVALSANPIPTIKEPEMNNTTLKLLLTLMGVTTETIKDATNSNYIGIITDSDNTYIGYVYADTIKQLKEIIAKSENEGNTIHCFKFQDSFKQATRPVVKVSRTTSEETTEEV